MTTTRDQFMEENGYVIVSVAAERAGFSISNIYKLLNTGKIEGTKYGQMHYVKLSSLIEYMGEDAARLRGLLP